MFFIRSYSTELSCFLKELPVGSIYTEVEGQNHFAMTKGETVIAEITVYGPSGVTYVNPADDLKNGKKRASFRLLNYMLTEQPGPSGSGTPAM